MVSDRRGQDVTSRLELQRLRVSLEVLTHHLSERAADLNGERRDAPLTREHLNEALEEGPLRLRLSGDPAL